MHEGEMEGEVPSHVVAGRMQGHSLHLMQRSWASVHVSQWTSILPLSISLDSEEGEGRVQWRGLSAVLGVGHVECCAWGVKCAVRCRMWSVVTCGITCGTWQRKYWLLTATVSITVKPSLLPWLRCDCVWRTRDSGKGFVCNAILATQIYISRKGKHSCLHENGSARLRHSHCELCNMTFH